MLFTHSHELGVCGNMYNMKEKEIEKTLKSLANGRRLAILSILKKEQELTVGELAEKIKLSFKSTSRHLGVMLSSSILEKEQRSSNVYYKISPILNEPARRIILLL